MPKRNILRNASRGPGEVSTASPASPVSCPPRTSFESRAVSRQSTRPASPVRGRSSELTKRQRDSAAA